MIYNFTKNISSDQLTSEIRSSSITIALESIDTVGNSVSISFKAALSNDEQQILSNIVSAHIPVSVTNPPLEVQVLQPKDSAGIPLIKPFPFSDAGGFRFRGASFSGVAEGSNAVTDIEYKLTAERFINGGRLLVDNIGPEDQITFQVVDKDNVLGLGVGVVLDEFISNYFVPTTGNLEVRLDYPARVPAGLYLRLKYKNTGSNSTKVKCNLYLHWKAA